MRHGVALAAALTAMWGGPIPVCISAEQGERADAVDIAAGREGGNRTHPHLTVEGADVHALVAGQGLFRKPHDNIRWGHDRLDGFENAIVVTDLNRDEPLTIKTEVAGHLYAVLWKWDFGFLGHCPDGDLNGWMPVGETSGAIQDFGPPFSPVSLYRRPLSAGSHSVVVTEYFGQWVIVGFAPDDQARGDAMLPAVELHDTSTRHHVYDPGDRIVVRSDAAIAGAALYRNGAIVRALEGRAFAAPDQPGRYVLLVTTRAGTRLVPITVGYGPIDVPGWPKGFFPIGFYGVSSAMAAPNPDLQYELGVLAQFELGANVFPTHRRQGEETPQQKAADALLDAIGARRIMKLPQCRWPVREKKMDDRRAVYIAMFEISHHGRPEHPATLGLYIEDETPPEYAFRMEKIEQAFRAQRERWPGRHLLYCLGGAGDWRDAVVWRIAGSSVLMARSYPIRQSHRADPSARARQIQTELADMIVRFQEMKTDKQAPFWIVIQAFGTGVRPPLWDPPSPAQLRLMVNLALARGVRGVTYFGFGSTPNGSEDLKGISRWPYVPTDGRYAEIGRINAHINASSDLLASLSWVESIPQETDHFDVQRLQHDDGRAFVRITNRSYTQPRSGSVRLPGTDQSTEVSLSAGDARMMEVTELE